MTLPECFIAMEGDYDSAIGRLLTEERVKKFLIMFLQDDCFENLCIAIENKDWATAFRYAHTLKGTCANLGISKLQKSSTEITEALRGNVNNGADELLPRVISDYNQTITVINQLGS